MPYGVKVDLVMEKFTVWWREKTHFPLLDNARTLWIHKEKTLRDIEAINLEEMIKTNEWICLIQ